MKAGNIGDNLIKMFFKKREGLAQIPLLIGLMIMAVAIPVATKLVQQNQESRSSAAGSGCMYWTSVLTYAGVEVGDSIKGNMKSGSLFKDENGTIFYCHDNGQWSTVKSLFNCERCSASYGCKYTTFKSNKKDCSDVVGVPTYEKNLEKCGPINVEAARKVDSSANNDACSGENLKENGEPCDTNSECRSKYCKYITNTYGVPVAICESTGGAPMPGGVSDTNNKKKYIVYKNGSCQDSSNLYSSLEECNDDPPKDNCYTTPTACETAHPAVGGSSGTSSGTTTIKQDSACVTKKGVCQKTSTSCSGSYTTGDCPSSGNDIKCCVPAVGGSSSGSTSDAGTPVIKIDIEQKKYIALDKVKITSTCTNCHHIGLFVDDIYVPGSAVNASANKSIQNYVYEYQVKEVRNYRLEVKACSIDSSSFGNICPDKNLSSDYKILLVSPTTTGSGSVETGSGSQQANNGTNQANSTCSNSCKNSVGNRSTGDANCDGKIDGADLSIYRRESIDKVMTVGSLWAADFNCDEVVNSVDEKIVTDNYITIFE